MVVSDQPAVNKPFENNKLSLEQISLTGNIFLGAGKSRMIKFENITCSVGPDWSGYLLTRTKLSKTLNNLLKKARALWHL